MSDSIEIIPTVVAKNAGEFAEAVTVAENFARAIHLDVGDGIFTKEISWPFIGAGEFAAFGIAAGKLPVEAHLMVQDPTEIGSTLASAGIMRVIGHIEAWHDSVAALLALRLWHGSGAEAGISILVGTELSAIDAIAQECDVIQVMGVATIGAQGALFDRRAIERVEAVHARYPRACIAVDGGVSKTNIEALVHAGARRFAVGSAIMKTPNPVDSYNVLKSLAEHALQ